MQNPSNKDSLGWAVSKNLAEANEGSIEVESEVGKGSTFTVRLPSRGWRIEGTQDAR